MRIKINHFKLSLLSVMLQIVTITLCLGEKSQVLISDFPLNANLDSIEVKLRTLDTKSKDFIHTLIHKVIIEETVNFSFNSDNVDHVVNVVYNNKEYRPYTNIADYLVASNFEQIEENKAYEMLLPVLKNFRSNSDTVGIFMTLNILLNLDIKTGSRFSKNDDLDGNKYYNEAYAIAKVSQNPYMRLKSHAFYFYNVEDTILPQENISLYLNEADEIIYQNPTFEYLYFNLYLNLGIYYKKRSDFERSNKFYRKSLSAVSDHYRQLALFNFANIFLQSNNYQADSAIYHLEIAYTINGITDFKSVKYDIANTLSQLYYEKGDYHAAWDYTLKKDSIRELMVNLQKEKSILQIQTKNKLEYENDRTLLLIHHKRLLTLGILLLVIIIVFLLYAIKSSNELKIIEKREIEFKEQLNTIIMHDLKSPFIAMDRLITNQPISQQDYQSLLGYVKNGHRLVNDLLTWSKLKINKGLGESKVINVYDCLKSISDEYMFGIRQKNISLRLNVDKNLHCKMKCESVKLIISNLLSNSIKHSEASVIVIFTEVKGNRIIINLSDNGKGIPSYMEYNIRKILYEQNNNVIRSGLGFSIIKSLVKMANAKIEFTTNRFGSTFSLQLKT